MLFVRERTDSAINTSASIPFPPYEGTSFRDTQGVTQLSGAMNHRYAAGNKDSMAPRSRRPASAHSWMIVGIVRSRVSTFLN